MDMGLTLELDSVVNDWLDKCFYNLPDLTRYLLLTVGFFHPIRHRILKILNTLYDPIKIF